ncbi:MAG: hypothetical protein WBF31_20825, partial [Anaerolineae bacterium]
TIWAQQFRIGRTIDHKERIEHKATAADSQIGGVFALFVFYVAKIRPSFSPTNSTNLCEQERDLTPGHKEHKGAREHSFASLRPCVDLMLHPLHSLARPFADSFIHRVK